MSKDGGETRAGVDLTHLDDSLFADAGATKRDLIDYLDAVSDRMVPELAHRPLSVIRVHRGQEAFMQKNVPKYTPEWVPTVRIWAEASKREVAYALCNDRRTLLWFGNQRAIEYHPALARADRLDRITHLVLDLDPPEGSDFAMVVWVARLVREVLDDLGLQGAVKTSGAKGLHVFVPIDDGAPPEDSAAATRAIAARTERLDPTIATTAFIKDDRDGKVFVDSTRVGGATVIACFSPRLRPGVPVSYPLRWDDLDDVRPADFTIHTALQRLGDSNPWAAQMVAPQHLSADLVAEGHEIPVSRLQAMHEGKRCYSRAPIERHLDVCWEDHNKEDRRGCRRDASRARNQETDCEAEFDNAAGQCPETLRVGYDARHDYIKLAGKREVRDGVKPGSEALAGARSRK